MMEDSQCDSRNDSKKESRGGSCELTSFSVEVERACQNGGQGYSWNEWSDSRRRERKPETRDAAEPLIGVSGDKGATTGDKALLGQKSGAGEVHHTSNSIASIATLCNSAVGAGVLSLPFAFHHAGVIGGLLLTLAVGLVEGFTMYVLVRFSDHTGQETYSFLVRSTLGSNLSAVLAVVLVVQTFGSCSAYLIIIGDTFSSLMSPQDQGGRDGSTAGDTDRGFVVSRQAVVLLLGLTVVMPMSFAKKLGHLSHMSSLAVAGFIYTSLVVVGIAVENMFNSTAPLKDVSWLKLDFSMLTAIPIIVFGFNCHANAISIYNEIVDKPDCIVPWLISPKNKSARLMNMMGVVYVGIMFIMFGYLAVGTAGYLSHPVDMASNVLNILPSSIFVQIARAVIGVVVLVHYPVTYHPGRDGFKDVVAMAGFEAASRSQILSSCYTVVFVLGTMLVASTVQELGHVISLIGGTVASFMIFFIPGMMLVKASYQSMDAKGCKDAELEHMLPKGRGDGSSSRGDRETRDMDPSSPKAGHRCGNQLQSICFSPGVSFWSGIALVLVSIFICVVTIILAVENGKVHR